MKTDLFDPSRLYTVEEYLRLEAMSLEKHDYLNGRVFPTHQPPVQFARLGGETRREKILRNVVILVEKGDLPRGSSCAFEVYSPATAITIRTARFDEHRQSHLTQAILLVDQDEVRVEVFSRLPGDSWRYEMLDRYAATIHVSLLSIEVRVAEIYAGVEFDALA